MWTARVVVNQSPLFVVPESVEPSRLDHAWRCVLVVVPFSNPVWYDYLSLARLPVVSNVVPGSGPTEGGTLVTVTGSFFQSRGVVTFESSNSGLFFVVGECRWNGSYPGTNYSDDSVRYEHVG